MQNLNHACRDTPPTKMEVINSDYQRLDHNSTQIDEETPQVVPNSLPKNHNQIQNHNNYVNRRWVNSRSTWLMIVIGALIAVSVIAIIKHFGPSFMKKVFFLFPHAFFSNIIFFPLLFVMYDLRIDF